MLAPAALMQRYVGRVTAYRVLYTSTGYDGKPTAVSGIIVVPDGPPPAGGRRVIAYTHGITARLVEKLCADGETVDLRILKGTAHLDAGHVAVPDVVQWIADRFASEPAPTTCT